MQKVNTVQKDDVWVHSACWMCIGTCGILVHRVDGVVVDIKGDPDCPNSRGKLCAKGYSAIMSLYDPHRLKTPLKRTNPEKGLGVDPGWVPISWDEALDILQDRLTKVRKEDPRKLVLASFIPLTFRPWGDWAEAFGTPNGGWGGYFCGQYLHSAMYLTNGTFHCDFDAEYCNYLILLGNQAGFGVGLNPNPTTQKVAAARKRGMKIVVVDPLCTNAGSKADEWLPIRPGTDGALVFAMINVLLNDLGIYDREFIKKYTNGPYLVKPDGYYARREGKPLVWDTKEGIAKTYDAEVQDYAIEAIEGSYLVDGVECLPAFHLLKEHVKKYTPEMAAEITTIPATTIRRMAEEFGKEARIGSTIVVDGKEFPYRPAAINIYRGAGAHKHGVASSLAVQTLNQIVGNFYVPGGHRGTNLIGPSRSWEPTQVDGMVLPPHTAHEGVSHGVQATNDYYNYESKPHEGMGFRELFPVSSNTSPMSLASSLDPEKYNLPYKPEVLIICGRNLIGSGVNYKITSEALKKYRFIAFFGTHLDESSEFADLALPNTQYLEDLILFPNNLPWSNTAVTGYWCWGIRQPVVPPAGEARYWVDVLMELAERMGFLGDIYERFNQTLKEPYKLDTSKKYSEEEICDRRAKSQFGEEKGLDWFKENGYFSWKRSVDELFPLPSLTGKVRFPIYFENYLRAGNVVKDVAEGMGLKDWDVSDYQALPDWKPCPAYEEKGEFDLFAFNFRVPTATFSWSAQNPWLGELTELNPYAQRVVINTQYAKRKGIKDKDRVCVESAVGKVFGNAKVTECVHPEATGISGHFGRLAKGMPVAYDKGTNFNNLLPFSLEVMDPVSTGVDACVKVKVYKV